MKKIFDLVVLKEASDFFDLIDTDVVEKIYYNIDKVAAGHRDPTLFKKLGDSGIWEFRTIWMGLAYRVFAFWDKDEKTLVVATHGIVKKSQKTPKKEIKKAQAIRDEYFKDKP